MVDVSKVLSPYEKFQFRTKYRTSLKLLSNNLEMVKTRLSLRESALQRNVIDTEQSIQTAINIQSLTSDFNQLEIEEFRRLIETLSRHIKLYDQAVTHYKQRETQFQTSETESESQGDVETLSQVE